MEHRTVTLSDQVFERLQNQILSGEYAHGEVLTEMTLVADLGVSRTPIREAIQRLEQEHLVSLGTKGIIVLGITQNDLRDIYEIRLLLEGIAARKVAERITDQEIERIKEVVELQEYYVPKKDSEHIKEQDSRFHALIYELCGSVVLADTLEPLHRKVQKYRKAAVSNFERAIYSTQEHREIFEAIAAHNGDLAEEKMIMHVKNAMKNLLRVDNGTDDSSKNN